MGKKESKKEKQMDYLPKVVSVDTAKDLEC